jgi:hypothetical protein
MFCITIQCNVFICVARGLEPASYKTLRAGLNLYYVLFNTRGLSPLARFWNGPTTFALSLWLHEHMTKCRGGWGLEVP